MLENLKPIWAIIRGRVITDLNVIGVIILMWIVAHINSNTLPVVNMLPAALQPLAKLAFPVAWWAICQYCIVLSRTEAVTKTAAEHQAEIEHIRAELARDYTDFRETPTVKTVAVDVAKTVIPMAEAAVIKEIPIAAPIVEAVVHAAEQAAGLDVQITASNTAGGEHVPPVVNSPTVVAPGTAAGPVA